MLTESRTINVLGTDIRVLFRKEADDPKLKNMVGYFEGSKALIVVKILEPDENSLGDLDKYQMEALRHEIIHAFMFESGLGANWEHKPIGHEETTIDWIAAQFPKLLEVFEKVGAL